METEDLKNKTSLVAFFKKAAPFFNRKGHWTLAFVFLVLIGYGAYLWYGHIINPGWGEARRQEYINTKQNGSIFNKDKFDTIVRGVEGKRSEYGRNIENIPDIFRLN